MVAVLPEGHVTLVAHPLVVQHIAPKMVVLVVLAWIHLRIVRLMDTAITVVIIIIVTVCKRQKVHVHFGSTPKVKTRKELL